MSGLSMPASARTVGMPQSAVNRVNGIGVMIVEIGAMKAGVRSTKHAGRDLGHAGQRWGGMGRDPLKKIGTL